MFLVLFDSGSDKALISRGVIPEGVQPHRLNQRKKLATLAGSFSCDDVVTMRDICLPEFDKNRRLNEHKALVFDMPACRYDIIFGADFL